MIRFPQRPPSRRQPGDGLPGLLFLKHPADDGDGFVLVNEGEMGHYHAPPLTAKQAEVLKQRQAHHPLRLWVRHYLERDDETGLVHIHLSRLVAVLLDTEVKR